MTLDKETLIKIIKSDIQEAYEKSSTNDKFHYPYRCGLDHALSLIEKLDTEVELKTIYKLK